MGCCTLLHLTEDNARFVLLAIVLVLYMLAGAAIFQYLEGDEELAMSRDFWATYSEFRRHYLRLLQHGDYASNFTSTPNSTDPEEDSMDRVHRLLYAYGNATAAGIIHKRRRWDFAGSFHFVATVVSTISTLDHSSQKNTPGTIMLNILAVLFLAQGVMMQYAAGPSFPNQIGTMGGGGGYPGRMGGGGGFPGVMGGGGGGYPGRMSGGGFPGNMGSGGGLPGSMSGGGGFPGSMGSGGGFPGSMSGGGGLLGSMGSGGGFPGSMGGGGGYPGSMGGGYTGGGYPGGGSGGYSGGMGDYISPEHPPHAGVLDKGVIRTYKQLGRALDLITPIGGKEEGYYDMLKTFLDNEEVMTQILGTSFDASIFETRGSFAKALLEKCLQSEQVQQQPALMEAIRYMQEKIPLRGDGEEPTNLTGVARQDMRHLNLNEAFLAFDVQQLEQMGLSREYGDVKYFFAHFLRPEEHLREFDMFQYNTRGEVMRGLLEQLLSNNNVPQNTKFAVQAILPHVMMHGPGAQSAFIEESAQSEVGASP